MEIHLVPILLGSGERLFEGTGTDFHGLELVRTVAVLALLAVVTVGGFAFAIWQRRPDRELRTHIVELLNSGEYARSATLSGSPIAGF